MARGGDGGSGDHGSGDDAVDPSDWLASQFTEADDEAPDAAPPTSAPSWFDQAAALPPRVPPAAPPHPSGLPAIAPAAAVVPAAGVVPPPFDWGFGRAAAPDEMVSSAALPPPKPIPPAPFEPPASFTAALAGVPAPFDRPAPGETELLSSVDVPTVAMESAGMAVPPTTESPSEATPTELVGVAPSRGAAFWDVGGPAPRETTTAMDALLARGSVAAAEPAEVTFPLTAERTAAAGTGGSRAALTRNQAILGAILIVAIVLVLLFLIGTRIPALTGSSATAVVSTPTPRVTPTPTRSPSPTVAPTGPAAVGSHDWKLLRGGECISPFVSPFAETFTVVDCTAAHSAQLVARGTFPPTTPDSYPGLSALQSQINLLCTTPAVINLATAGAYADIQVQAAYAANAAEWASGQHDYFCFVSRSSAQPLMNSVAAG